MHQTNILEYLENTVLRVPDKIAYLDENGNPAAAPVVTEEFEDGIAGETVTGTPKKASADDRFAGYVHDPAAAGSVLSGTVVASTDPDYPLTLKLYYKPGTYRVIYEYVGILPANRSPLPAAAGRFPAPASCGLRSGPPDTVQPRPV